MNSAELLLPAGDLEKLKTAIIFGADAVYLGGKDYSLRAAAGNLTLQEMAEGLIFAHEQGKKVYVAVNILAHNSDLHGLPAYLESLQAMHVDGIIVSDLGILRLARQYAANIPITISTQANISNYEAAAFCKDLGASRLVLARELTMDEIIAIKEKVDIELEVFVHGAMCVSYSGRCLLSHYMTGRNANTGACAHPCRYQYHLMEEKRPNQYFPIEEDERGTYILNSRDLCLLPYLPQLLDAGVDSFKVEGRMKSPLYVAAVASVYRQAIASYQASGTVYSEAQLQEWLAALNQVASRPFTNGFIEGESPLLQDIHRDQAQTRADFCGVVKGFYPESGQIEVEQRANFGPGDPLQLMLPDGRIIKLDLTLLFDVKGNPLDRARHALQLVRIPFNEDIPAGSILRRVGGLD